MYISRLPRRRGASHLKSLGGVSVVLQIVLQDETATGCTVITRIHHYYNYYNHNNYKLCLVVHLGCNPSPFLCSMVAKVIAASTYFLYLTRLGVGGIPRSAYAGTRLQKHSPLPCRLNLHRVESATQAAVVLLSVSWTNNASAISTTYY